MDLPDEITNHRFSNFKIRNHPILHGTNGDDVARRLAQHELGILADRQHPVGPPLILADRHDRRFTKNNPLISHIDKRVGGTKVNRQIIGEPAQNAIPNHQPPSPFSTGFKSAQFIARDGSIFN